MKNEVNNLLWCEKYRPQTIDECVLPKEIIDRFRAIVKDGNVPNMIFSGSAGVGKTTVAKALCLELGLDWIMINGSEESGIDTLRNKIRQFASTVSMMGDASKPKVIIIDEADYLNASSTQPALRGVIEEYAKNCRFILTCNFPLKIIQPLHSRCAPVEFKVRRSDKAMLGGFHKRMCAILDAEEVAYDKKMLASIIMRWAPDWRRIINECQNHTVEGELRNSALSSEVFKSSIADLFGALKDKDFKSVRSWVAQHADLESGVIFRSLYDHLYTTLKPHSIPPAILIISEYMHKSAFAVDAEINLTACMIELMAEAQFK